MAKLPVLIDSGFLFELFDASQPRHQAAVNAISSSQIRPLIPQVVLSETAFLFQRTGGTRQSAAFLLALSEFPAESVLVERVDFLRASSIMLHYEDARLDFVDCCIMALCERLNITTVCTFDRRDFSLVSLAHTEHLTLLPETV